MPTVESCNKGDIRLYIHKGPRYGLKSVISSMIPDTQVACVVSATQCRGSQHPYRYKLLIRLGKLGPWLSLN